MKRTDLIRYLEKRGGEFFREGGDHTVFINRIKREYQQFPVIEKSMKTSAVKSVKI